MKSGAVWISLIFGLVFTTACEQAVELRSLQLQPSSAESQPELRVVSYNVWGLPRPLLQKPSRLPDIARLIPSLNADILTFQETFSEDTHVLARLPEYPHVAWGPKRKTLMLSSGILTISKWPIVETATMTYTKCAGFDCLARKGALYTRIAVPGIGDVDVFTSHLNANAKVSLHLHQTKEFFAFIAKHSGNRPLIVTGDFNFTTGSEPYHYFLKLLSGRDAHAEYVAQTPGLSEIEADGFTADPRRNTNLKMSGNSPRRLDHIWISESAGQPIEVARSGMIFEAPVSGRHLSDHFGIMNTLRIAPVAPVSAEMIHDFGSLALQ
jgi:endonuclease/exonuclease/phosphatase family metal-dependent hydrolase